jgi:predicted metal-dependent HD superfamily phosphohydrolase
MIKQLYLNLAARYAATTDLPETLWLEIETAYTAPDRHFHDLDHLAHLYRELQVLQPKITDWDTLFFSLCYHDVVYDVEQNIVANDNEEKSAALAERHLRLLGYPTEKIEKCCQQIRATQKHHTSRDKDTNYLTDADLSILGQPWKVYAAYKNNIRKEFQVYPEHIYNTGRRKVLELFLSMEPLFKTAHFRQLYEQKAKDNIRKELQLLYL